MGEKGVLRPEGKYLTCGFGPAQKGKKELIELLRREKQAFLLNSELGERVKPWTRFIFG